MELKNSATEALKILKYKHNTIQQKLRPSPKALLNKTVFRLSLISSPYSNSLLFMEKVVMKMAKNYEARSPAILAQVLLQGKV